MTTTTNCKQVYVNVTGLKKRDRSIKRHSFDLGHYPSNTTIEDLEPIAKAYVRDNMRSVNNNEFEIRSSNHTIEMRDGMRIERFSSRDVYNAERKLVTL